MEYFVSNINFDGATKIGDIYVKGNIIQIGCIFALCEGYILDENIPDFESYIKYGIENIHADGIYGIILYDLESKKLIVKGDYNGLRSIYIYEREGRWAISNNVWLLVKEFKRDITINQDSLISQIVFITDVVPRRTVFNEIRRLNYGEKIIWDGKGQLNFYRYWDFHHNPKEVDVNQVLKTLDESFTKGFSLIKKRNPDLTMGIGCSGGLDSRIIMHYANKVGIDHVPFVFCQKQRIKGVNTATYLMSERVAGHFGKSVIPISIINNNQIENSILLDLRNQPFGFCQLSKNPYNMMPSFDYMMTGQPGGMAYAPNFVSSDNVDDIVSYISFFLGNRIYSFGKFKYFLRKLRTSFPIKFNPSKESGITGLDKSLIDQILPKGSIEKAKNELRNTILNVKGKSNYETWLRLQGIIVNAIQYSGGYESLSNLKQSYYLYLLGWNKMLTSLNPIRLINKTLLKKFITYIDPYLANIPDQHLNRISDGKLKNILHQIEYIIRGQGINVESLIASREYQKYAKVIMQRENPVFYKNINKEIVLKSGIMSTSFSPTILKRKLMIDIFYYGEFDKLLTPVSWQKA